MSIKKIALHIVLAGISGGACNAVFAADENTGD